MSFSFNSSRSLYKTNKFIPVPIYQNIPIETPMQNTNLINPNITKQNLLTLTSQIDNLKTQNTMAIASHSESLSKLQDSMFKCYTKANKSYHPGSVLSAKQSVLNEYFQRNLPQNVELDVNYRLLSQQNELIAVKSVLEKQINQNSQLLDIERECCEKMAHMNNDLFEKVKQLNEQNDQLTYERKKLQKTYTLMEENLGFSLMAEMSKKPKEREIEIQKISVPIDIPEIEEKAEESETEEDRKRRYKVTNEKIVQLKMNHQPGKLDEIRKQKLEKALKDEQEKEKEQIKMSQLKEKYERPFIVKTEMIVEKGDNANTGTVQNSVKQYSSQFKKMETKDYIDHGSKTKYEDLSSKTITVQQKMKVLKTIIERFEKLSGQSKDNIMIYTENSLKANKHRRELREMFNMLLDNPNAKVTGDLMSMLLYEIINSNYHLNLNPEKLREKDEYNPDDFDLDLNEDYKGIVNATLEHLRKIILDKKATLDLASKFMARALINFEYDDFMLARLVSVLEYKLEP